MRASILGSPVKKCQLLTKVHVGENQHQQVSRAGGQGALEKLLCWPESAQKGWRTFCGPRTFSKVWLRHWLEPIWLNLIHAVWDLCWATKQGRLLWGQVLPQLDYHWSTKWTKGKLFIKRQKLLLSFHYQLSEKLFKRDLEKSFSSPKNGLRNTPAKTVLQNFRSCSYMLVAEFLRKLIFHILRRNVPARTLT